MTTQSTQVSQRESYDASYFRRFLWWLATAEKELIVDCSLDRNRYAILGYIVLSTWLFATMSWTYFFSTAVADPLIYCLLGLFMGFIVLCIDRALIKGITRQNKRNLSPYLLRGALALVIGAFLAQPAVLYLFDKEIRLQVSLDNEKRRMEKSKALDTLYLARKSELAARKLDIVNRQAELGKSVELARLDYLREADGTGGTGRVGIKSIALAKKTELEKLEQAYGQMQESDRPGLQMIESEQAGIDSSRKAQLAAFDATLNHGFLTRIEALSNLLDGSQALRLRYYLIMAILMLIELMPVIVKSLLPSGAYEEKTVLRESMEKELAFENTQLEKEMKSMYNKLMAEEDQRFLREFVATNADARRQRLERLTERFRDRDEGSFDELWEKVKRDMLSKQEN